MRRKLIAAATALALAIGTLAPAAQAEDYRRDGYYGGDRHYDRGRHHDRWDRRYDRSRRGNDDDGEAIAAGVIGLVLGLAIASAASEPRQRQSRCDNYQRCAPPPGYYQQQQGYYQGGYQGGYQDQYPDQGSAYERDYGRAPPQRGYDPYYGGPPQPECTRRERQWDRYANRYVVVDVPC